MRIPFATPRVEIVEVCETCSRTVAVVATRFSINSRFISTDNQARASLGSLSIPLLERAVKPLKIFLRREREREREREKEREREREKDHSNAALQYPICWSANRKIQIIRCRLDSDAQQLPNVLIPRAINPRRLFRVRLSNYSWSSRAFDLEKPLVARIRAKLSRFRNAIK